MPLSREMKRVSILETMTRCMGRGGSGIVVDDTKAIFKFLTVDPLANLSN